MQTIERFLVFPLTIGNELRWLEKAKYEVRCFSKYTKGNFIKIYYGWSPIRWIE